MPARPSMNSISRRRADEPLAAAAGSLRAAPRPQQPPSHPSPSSGNGTSRSLLEQRRRAVQHTHAVHRQAERSRRRSGASPSRAPARPPPSRQRRRPSPSASSSSRARSFGPAAAALDEAADRDAVIAAVDQLPCSFALLIPAELVKATVEDLGIIAAVAFGLRMSRRDRRGRACRASRSSAMRLRRRISARSMARSFAAMSSSRSQKKLASYRPGRAIGPGRSLVGHQHRGSMRMLGMRYGPVKN